MNPKTTLQLRAAGALRLSGIAQQEKSSEMKTPNGQRTKGAFGSATISIGHILRHPSRCGAYMNDTTGKVYGVATLAQTRLLRCPCFAAPLQSPNWHRGAASLLDAAIFCARRSASSAILSQKRVTALRGTPS